MTKKKSKEPQMSFATTLPDSLIKTLKAEARQRRIQQNKIVQAALEAFFHPEGQDNRDAMIARRLNRIDARQRATEQQLEIIAETMALYIRVWFTNTNEVPDSQRETANLQGNKRFDRFVKALADRLGKGNTLYSELPHEVIVKEKDFEKATVE